MNPKFIAILTGLFALIFFVGAYITEPTNYGFQYFFLGCLNAVGCLAAIRYHRVKSGR